MKSRMKCVKPVVDAGNVEVQLSLPMAGVLRDVRHAFFGLCVHAGKQVLAAMMEADRQVRFTSRHSFELHDVWPEL